jgi:hypothetical protein
MDQPGGHIGQEWN